MNDSNRFEYEVMSQLQYWEDIHRKGWDYMLKEDPDFMVWLEDRKNEDLAYRVLHEESN